MKDQQTLGRRQCKGDKRASDGKGARDAVPGGADAVSGCRTRVKRGWGSGLLTTQAPNEGMAPGVLTKHASNDYGMRAQGPRIISHAFDGKQGAAEVLLRVFVVNWRQL